MATYYYTWSGSARGPRSQHMEERHASMDVHPAYNQHGRVEVVRMERFVNKEEAMTRGRMMDRLVAAGLILGVWAMCAAWLYWLWTTHAGGPA